MLRFSFDERTLIGYTISTLMLAFTIYVILYMVTGPLAIIVLVFINSMAIVNDMREQVQSFNDIRGNRPKMVEWIREFHTDH